MARLPFNPDRISAPESETSSPPATRQPASKRNRPLSVTDVAGLIKATLTDNLPGKIRVVGEVSNFSDRYHWFFSLKDDNATLRCVCFASAARRIDCPVEDGMEVVATGRIDFYDAQGHVQLYVDKIEPVGQGALELKLRQLIDQLRQQGYFDEIHKKPLPPFAQRIAVVTSRSGAALQDVINTAAGRFPACQLLLYDVKVQGASAAPDIARAIERLSRQGHALGIDAVLLTRGGGSIEDLWAFNERAVADALHRCPIPVVAAIGHETDTTVAELVADLRCATPTQAAMKLVPERAALHQELRHWTDRLHQDIRRQFRHARHRVDTCANRGFFLRPRELFARPAQRLNELHGRLRRALPHRLRPGRLQLDQAQQRLRTALPRRLQHDAETLARIQSRFAALRLPLLREPKTRLNVLERELHTAFARLLRDRRADLDATARQLDALSPQRVLERGYTYTLGPDGKLLRQPDHLQQGDPLTTVLAHGRVRSRVETPANTSSATPPPAEKPPRPKPRSRPVKRHQPDPNQPGLF